MGNALSGKMKRVAPLPPVILRVGMSALLLCLLVINLMEEILLPPFSDQHDEVTEYHEGNDADKNNIQTEEIHALGVFVD